MAGRCSRRSAAPGPAARRTWSRSSTSIGLSENSLRAVLLADALCYSTLGARCCSRSARFGAAFDRWTRADSRPRSGVARRARRRRADHARTPCCCGSGIALSSAPARRALAAALPPLRLILTPDLLDGPDRDGRRPRRRAHAARALSRRVEPLASALLALLVAVLASQSNFEGIGSAPLFIAVRLVAPRDPRRAARAGRRGCSGSTCTCAASRRWRTSAASRRRRCSPRRTRRRWCRSPSCSRCWAIVLGTGFGLVMAGVLASLAPSKTGVIGCGRHFVTLLAIVRSAISHRLRRRAHRVGEPLPSRAWRRRRARTAQLDPAVLDRRAAAPMRIVARFAATPSPRRTPRCWRSDPSLHRPRAPAASAAAARDVRGWIEELSAAPDANDCSTSGGRARARADARRAGRQRCPRRDSRIRATRYGLVVRARGRCARFPTRAARIPARTATPDIDRFQESALFPGTPVAIAHESRDGDWWFVVSPLYAAWVEKRAVARRRGRRRCSPTRRKSPVPRGHGRDGAHRLHAGARRRSPSCSSTWACACRCSPTGPRTARSTANIPMRRTSIELPVRDADGALRFTPALLPRTADIAARLPAAHARATCCARASSSSASATAGATLQRARLQRLRLRGLSQLRRPAAAQHARPGASARRSTASRSTTRARTTQRAGGRVAACRSATSSTSRARDDGDRPRSTARPTSSTTRPASAIATRTARCARVRLNGVSVTPLTPLLFGDTTVLRSTTSPASCECVSRDP